MLSDSLTMRDLCARFRVDRWTIHRWMRDNAVGFPKGSIKPGVKGRRWSANEVDQWDAMMGARSEVMNAGDDPR
jgi:predicted DNA-binding transcriptional regulator AlpA